MSKKNSNVNLKIYLRNSKDFSNIYSNFKNKFKSYKKKSFVIAVSGGPDSLGLVALSKTYNFENKINFKYVLVNHNIRKNSSSEAKKVKNLLSRQNIKLDIVTNYKPISKNIQGEARNARYKLLTEYCRKKNIKNLVTAHNLEDQVETFFIRLSRGSGLTGLSSMNEVTKIENSINLYRPLLDVKKISLKKISANVFGNYINDPSNKNSKYLRTRVRHLQKYLNKSGISYDQIIKSINNLASSKKVLDEHFKKIYLNTTKKFKNEIKIDLIRFNDLNNELKIRLINNSIKDLKRNYYNPRSNKVLNLINKITKRDFKSSTLGGCIFSKKTDHISLKKEKK